MFRPWPLQTFARYVRAAAAAELLLLLLPRAIAHARAATPTTCVSDNATPKMPRATATLAGAAAVFTTIAALLCTLMRTAATEAAHIQAGDFVLVFSTSDACPDGWQTLAWAPFAGRVIVRPRSDLSIQTPGTALTKHEGAIHQHAPIWLNMNTSTNGDLSGISRDPSRSRIAPASGRASVTFSGTDNLPYVVFHPCRYMSGPPLNVPLGLLVFSSNAYAQNVCPQGFSRYYDNANRLWAIASGEISGTPKNNATPSMPTDGGSLGGVHSHTVPTTNQALTNSFVTCCSTGTLVSSGGAYATRERASYQFIGVATDSSSLNIPYIHLVACRATNLTPSPATPPPPSMLFFSATDSCPSGFVDAATIPGQFDFAGRVPVLLNPGQMTVRTRFGGPPLSFATNATAPMPHNHVATASMAFTSSADWVGTYGSGSTSWLGVRPDGVDGPPAPFTFSVDSGASTNIQVPLTAYRLCQREPPTTSPTSSSPSISPTTPTTSYPSWGPTTSSPSRSPSLSTPSPVWSNVCTSADQAVFGTYDDYVVQAGACADACGGAFRTSTSEGRLCAWTTACASLDKYTKMCKQCAIEQIVCQFAQCESACASWRYSDACASCTNEKCRTSFSTCTGLNGTEVAAGGGTGGAKRPAPPQPVAVAVGASVAGVVAAAAAAMALVVVSRRRQAQAQGGGVVADVAAKWAQVVSRARGAVGAGAGALHASQV